MKFIRSKYLILLKKNWFRKGIALFFIFRAVSALIGVFYWAVVVLVRFGWSESLVHLENVSDTLSQFGFFDWGSLVTTIFSNLLIVVGLLKLQVSYYEGLKWFKRSVLVSIMFIQFFAFYHDQLIAVFGVIGDILLLYALNYMLTQRKNL